MQGFVYHASPHELTELDPSKSSHGVIFAHPDRIAVSAFLGRAGAGFTIGINPTGSILTELVYGAWDYRYREIPGYIYTLDASEFYPNPNQNRWGSEVISTNRVTPVKLPYVVANVREYLDELHSEGEIRVIRSQEASVDDILRYCMSRYEQDERWMPVIEKFLADVHPHLLDEFRIQVESRR